jgi:surface antigen
MKFKLIAFIAISSFLLSSCATTGTGTKVGAGLGVLAGAGACSKLGDGKAKLVAMVGCGLLGGILGAWIGSKWDETDKKEASSILNTSKDGDVMSWKNPDTDNKFKMTLLKTSTSAGQQCREFELVTNGNPPENRKACRNKNGTWEFPENV